jgi:hypothetical protein
MSVNENEVAFAGATGIHPRAKPTWQRIWRLVRPLLLVAMAMHVGFFAALALLAPVSGANVALLCTAMTLVVAASVCCVGKNWRENSTDPKSAKRWMTAGYFCVPCYQVLAIVVGGRMGLLTPHLTRLLGNTVLAAALMGVATFALPGRVWRKKTADTV